MSKRMVLSRLQFVLCEHNEMIVAWEGREDLESSLLINYPGKWAQRDPTSGFGDTKTKTGRCEG